MGPHEEVTRGFATQRNEAFNSLHVAVHPKRMHLARTDAGLSRQKLTVTRFNSGNLESTASVLITATIPVPSGMSAEQIHSALANALHSASAASSALGITVEDTPTVRLSSLDAGRNSLQAAEGGQSLVSS